MEVRVGYFSKCIIYTSGHGTTYRDNAWVELDCLGRNEGVRDKWGVLKLDKGRDKDMDKRWCNQKMYGELK